jgi:hypothetical protein
LLSGVLEVSVALVEDGDKASTKNSNGPSLSSLSNSSKMVAKASARSASGDEVCEVLGAADFGELVLGLESLGDHRGFDGLSAFEKVKKDPVNCGVTRSIEVLTLDSSKTFIESSRIK